MKAKTLIVLLIICGVLGGIAYWQLSGGAGKEAGDTVMGEELLGDLSVNEIAAIRIVGPENRATLGKETVWEVENRYGYPADFSRITDLVKKFRSVTVGRSFTGTEEARTRLSLFPPDKEGVDPEAKGTRVVLSDESGKALADILVGDPREASGAGTGGHYLMLLPDETVYLVDKSFRRLETDPGQWIVKELVEAAAGDVREVEYRTAGSESPLYILTRPEEGAEPEFQNRPAAFGEREIKSSEINTLFGGLSGFRIDDVADPEDPPAAETFDDRFEYRLFDGTWYRVTLGEAVPGAEEQYYVKLRAGYTAPPEPEAEEPPAEEAEEEEPEAEKKAEEAEKEAAEKRRQEQARLKQKALELDETLRTWTYIVPEWRYEKFKTDVATFFEEPPAAEPAAETDEGGMGPENEAPIRLE